MNPRARKDTSFSFTNVELTSSLYYQTNSNYSLSSGALSSSSLSDLRIASDWAFSFSAPFTDFLTVDALFLPPIDAVLNGNSGRIGSRAQFKIDSVIIENIETGWLSSDGFKTHEFYAAFNGTAFFDYNLCSSVKIDETFQKDEWTISASLCKSFLIQTDTDYTINSETCKCLELKLKK